MCCVYTRTVSIQALILQKLEFVLFEMKPFIIIEGFKLAEVVHRVWYMWL